ncbi:MAG: PHP domain-containing protein [Deltaproteobacteria bacterium]|nr:PHP domain-containing protein [Deltaproteobacteria bacterium]
MGEHHFEYIGNVHIHTRYSDGEKTVPEIARHAALANLDFIIINDHDYMAKTLHVEYEGYHGGVLVLMGLELGKRFHHYLAFDLSEMVRGKGLRPQSVIDHVKEKGGFGFLAHPFEKGMPFRDNSIAYTWNDLSVTGYTGICIWNFSSRWKERVRTVLHGLFFLVVQNLDPERSQPENPVVLGQSMCSATGGGHWRFRCPRGALSLGTVPLDPPLLPRRAFIHQYSPVAGSSPGKGFN